MLIKQRFVLDTSAFTDVELRNKLGDGDLTKTIENMVDLIAKARTKLNISCHMPPVTYKELIDYISLYDCPEEIKTRLDTWIVKKTPNRYETKIPSQIFYEYVRDMRERINKGMKIAEEMIWEAATESLVMKSRGHERQKIEVNTIGEAIREFRKKYRSALRKGTLDSAPDLDVLLLAKELDAGVVAADTGIKSWGERLGLRFLDATSFPKMIQEYLKYYR